MQHLEVNSAVRHFFKVVWL